MRLSGLLDLAERLLEIPVNASGGSSATLSALVWEDSECPEIVPNRQALIVARRRARMETFCTAVNCRRLPERLPVSSASDFSAEEFLTLSATSFSAALDLGAPDRWEDSTLQPTMLAMRRIVAHSLIPVGIAVSAMVAAVLVCRSDSDRWLQIHVGSIGFRLDRVNPASNLKNSVFSPRCFAPWQVSPSRRSACRFRGAAYRTRTHHPAFLELRVSAVSPRISTDFSPRRRGCCLAGRLSTTQSNGAAANRA